MASESVEAVVEDAKAYFVGVEVFNDRYVGYDIVLHDDDALLLVRDLRRHEVIGVRFPVPLLPLEGIAYRGEWMRTARDWILDLKVVLDEELGTGALFSGERVERQEWSELSIDFDNRWFLNERD